MKFEKRMSINFWGSPHTMGFVAFSRTMANWWGNPCISYMMKYTIGWGSNGNKAPILWEKYEYQFPRLSPYHGFCCIFPYCGKLMEKSMHFPYDDIDFFFFLSCESSGVILFFLLLCKFLFLPILKKLSSSFVVQDFNFYSNEYLHKNIHKYPSFLLSPRQNNVVWKFQNKSSSF